MKIFTAIMIILAIVWAGNVFPAQVTFTWDPNSESDLAGYKFYYIEGDCNNSFVSGIDVGNVTTYTFNGIESGRIYCFAVTAYNTQAFESGLSNKVHYAPGGYLLWANSSGQAKIQELDMNYSVVETHTYGPWSGYVPLNFTRGQYGKGYFLWKTTANQGVLWDMDDSSNTYSSYYLYGPWSGYTPLSFQMGDDNKGYFLWKTTANQGVLWTMNSLTTYSTYSLYGPWSGYTPLYFNTKGVDNKSYFLWKTTGGQADLWIMDNLMGYSDYRMFSLPGFTPLSYFKY